MSDIPTTTIKQSVTFSASPARVYEAYMKAEEHAEFTGAKAVIVPKVDGRFEVYDGYAAGTFTELIPGEVIASTWKELDPAWPAGHYSKLRIELSTNEDGDCELGMVHSEVPEDRSADIAAGWHDYYWSPLEEYLQDETGA